MENDRNEDGKSWMDLFKIKGDRNKQSKALKVNYPRLTNEDLKYNERDLFI